jgi:type I restriction enzyme, S subunit
MQVSKTKPNYKRVEFSFGLEQEIPKEWTLESLEKCCNILDSKRVPINSEERQKMKGNIPYCGANGIQDYVNKYLFDEDLMLLAEDGGYFDEYSTRPIAYLITGKSWVNNHAHVLSNKKGYDLRYLFYSLVHKNILPYINGSTRTKLNQSELRKIEILIPKLKEQQKIASILSNVDALINQTQKEIEHTQRLKKGLLQKLLTRGIGHTEFKKVNLGKPFLTVKIPKAWTVEPFKKILSVQQNSIDLIDSQKYVRITVKRRHDGIVLRDEVYGKQILTENQFRINAGEFIISRRQIIHNACGLVPKQFDGAVVSNEYSIFSGTHQLDINYFDYFSQTDLFHKTIVLTTHGVHIEKYILLLDEWLNLKMPLPPIDEQKRITRSIAVVEKKLLANLQFESHLKNLKKGLMQKLLTGQIRVKV